MADLIVRLKADGGATAQITVTLPAIRTPKIRLTGLTAMSVQAVRVWDGTKWQPA